MKVLHDWNLEFLSFGGWAKEEANILQFDVVKVLHSRNLEFL